MDRNGPLGADTAMSCYPIGDTYPPHWSHPLC